MQIFAHYPLLNSSSPRVYYSIQVTTHAQKDVPSNNTYNIDGYPISSYRLNFHVRTVARFLSCLKRISILPYSISFEWVYLAGYNNYIEITEFLVSEKSHRISPPGGHQANYSALRRCVTSCATVLSCRSPIGWRWWRIQPACYWLSGRNPKFNRHLANMRPGPTPSRSLKPYISGTACLIDKRSSLMNTTWM